MVDTNSNSLYIPQLKSETGRLGEKARPNNTMPTRNNFKYKNVGKLKVKGWQNTYNGNTNQKKLEWLY